MMMMMMMMIFGLRCDKKLEYSLALSFFFFVMGKVMPVVFGEIRMSLWLQKRPPSIFGKVKAPRKFR